MIELYFRLPNYRFVSFPALNAEHKLKEFFDAGGLSVDSPLSAPSFSFKTSIREFYKSLVISV